MEVPVSLYLKTKQGEHPDIKVAARSAIVFAEIIESIVASIEPDLQVKVEIVSGSEGSLGLNTLNKIVQRAKATAVDVRQGVLAGWKKHEKLRFLAVYAAIKILDNAAAWGQDQIMDWMASDDAPAEVQTLSVEDREALARDIAEELRRVDPDKVQRLYGQIAKDERIEAIGVTARPKPAVKLLRREQFTEQAVEPDDTDRVTTDRMEVTLVSPVLEYGERRWKLRGHYGEFGASIKDKDFLRSAITGETNLHLRGGVILDVDVATNERLIDGVWEVQLRSVEKVHGWREGPVQGDLLAPGS